jgi:HD-GYP domain-containing protein (c-di-GMP phosphodiesterase class II)
MSDTQMLLSKIAAVRQRLEKAQAHGPRSANSEIGMLPLLSDLVATVPAVEESERVHALQESVNRAARQGTVLDGCLQHLSAEPSALPAGLPHQLTPRAHLLLKRGRELLTQLRTIDMELGVSEESFLDRLDPLADWHRDTVAMVDVALHIVQVFPDAPSDQIRLCEGLEVILASVSQRVALLTQAMQKRRLENEQVETLADLLTCLEAGRPVDLKPFAQLAESLLTEARQATPLHFPQPFLHESVTNDSHDLDANPRGLDAHWVARFVACHSLIVAQVMARILHLHEEARSPLSGPQDPVGRRSFVEPVLAALVHDVGMLQLSAAIIAQAGPLTIDQKRTVEGHARHGADLVARFPSCPNWLTEAVHDHHERLDGTGYPAGKKTESISPITRLLAVCDVYAAMVAARPFRPARETRTALTDTLLLAEQGALDRDQAERLLQLSFYPLGSVVELADGAVGVVVAGPSRPCELDSPAKPVIALLTDSRGRPLATLQHLDLSRGTGRSIVRSLSPSDRQRIIGKHHPELV